MALFQEAGMISNILAFDTATNACSVALQHDGKIFSRFEIAPREHSQLLLSMIQSVLSEAKIKLSDLNAIAFGSGPGSFMGVRLALGMAQGLALGLNIPVIPISTLQILAQTAYQKIGQKNIIAGWDARLSSIYWGVYVCAENNVMQVKIPDSLNLPSEIDFELISKVNWLCAGNAWDVYSKELPRDFFHNKDQLIDVYPDAKSMCVIADLKYHLNEIISCEHAHPEYLRDHVANHTTRKS